MRLLPNMTVLECGDATDVESVLDVAQAILGFGLCPYAAR